MRSPWPRGGLWRRREFLYLWGAQSISQFGSQITLLALPLVAILVLESSAFEVSVLAALEWTPWLLFSLPAGAWVDRLRKRPIMIAADVVRAAALASVPIAHWLGVLTLGQLFVVGFVVGTMTVFFDVAYASILPAMVDRGSLAEGNAKLETSRSAAQFGGPGLAGALVSVLTAPVAILADAVSFVVSGLLLVRMRVSEALQPPSEREKLLTEVVEGVKFVAKHPYMRPSMYFVATSNLCWAVIGPLMLVYAVRDLGMTPARLGLVLMLANTGLIVGALLATRLGRALGVGPTIVGGAFFLGWPALLIPAAPKDFPEPFFVAAFAIVGFVGVAFNVVGISLFQATTPLRLQGRATASRRLVNFGAVPIGNFIGGGLAAAIGVHATLWVAAIGATFCFLPVLFSPILRLRDVPISDEDETPAPLAAVPLAPPADA